MKKIINKKSNTVFMTTVFPGCMMFFDDFMNSLDLQTDNNFDLLIVNDGVENLGDYLKKFRNINFLQIISSNSIVQNRKAGIDTIIDLNYEYLIFGDSDDYFDLNRVAVSKEYLNYFDIVVNDLSVFDKQNGVYKTKCFSKRLKNNSIIDFDYIKDKNIFGLSNTAIKVSEITKIVYSDDLIAFDWCFFSQLLSQNKSAVFTNETQTYYRQYSNNTIGLGNNSISSLRKGIEVKKKHYQFMKQLDVSFDRFFIETKIKEENINKNDIVVKEYKQDHLLWWENTKDIINN